VTRPTFHLIPAEVWAAADPGSPYRAATLQTEGFIHCTDGVDELLATADRHFRGDPREYLVLTVDLDATGSPWRFDGGRDIYPHVYGPIARQAILSIAPMVRQEAGSFVAIGPPSTTSEPTLYEAAGGFDRILALVRRWHQRCLDDPAAAHPFQHELHPQHDERLAAYLTEAFGGPALYTAGFGDESSVQRIHAGNGVHPDLDEACLAAFDGALADVGLTGAPAAAISAYFRRATISQRAYGDSPDQVPDGLPFNIA
jgi:hemoglobin